MNILFDNAELLRMITNLHTLTGIRANIFDHNGRDICLTGDHTAFCERINACPEGHARCVGCDAQAVKHCSRRGEVYFYRCHAGLCEAVLPITSGVTPIAYLAFGQLLDSTPIEEQWEKSRRLLDWYPGGADSLREDYFALRRYSEAELTAFAEVLNALGTYIHLSGMVQATEYSELQQLEIYLDQHYMDRISLSSVSAALGISRTKLCAMAKRLSGGKTLSYMIAERRVGAAKLLLLKSDVPISVVAESVGIADYNYFTKVFRSVTGMTPSAYRKQRRSQV